MNSKLSELENDSVPELTRVNCVEVRYMFFKEYLNYYQNVKQTV